MKGRWKNFNATKYFLRSVIIFFIGLCFTIPSVVSTPAQALDVDLDESGVIIKRDCDNSYESSFGLEDSHDIAVKGLYAPVSFVGIDVVQLFIYGKAWADEGTSDSHQIKIGTHTINFRAHEAFSSEAFCWAMFSPDLSWFTVNTQAIITIRDIGDDDSEENLYIGIDNDFFENSVDTMPDFQRSAWSHDFTGSNYPDPWLCSGELMVKLVFFKDQKWESLQSYTMGNSVQIDSKEDDYCWQELYVAQSDLSQSTRAQLYVYGYAFGNAAPNNQKLYLRINEHDPIYINAYDIFQKNNWAYGIIDMISTQYLEGNSYNRFYFGKMSDDTSSENIVIGIDNQGSSQYHAWKEDGTYSTYGNIMLGLEIFDADQTTPLRETQVTSIRYYDELEELYYAKIAAQEFSDKADDYGFDNINPEYDYDVIEADFYAQRYGDVDRADSADFVFHVGHGGYIPHGVFMSEYDPDPQIHNEMNPDDKYRFQFATYMTYVDIISEAEFSSDGWDTDPEWVWYMSCDVLKGVSSGTAKDNEFQTMLYHGTHFLFGYRYAITFDDSLFDVAQDFWYLSENHKWVKSAFIEANENNGIYVWAYYYHTDNHHDYLWGFESGPTFDCVDKDIDYVTGPSG